MHFDLPFRKGRQDSGEIKKNIYSSRKLKVAAGGWKAAGRRGKQECLVKSHSKGKSVQSLCHWVGLAAAALVFQELLPTERLTTSNSMFPVANLEDKREPHLLWMTKDISFAAFYVSSVITSITLR